MKKGTLDLALRDLSAVINRQSDHVESLYSRGMAQQLSLHPTTLPLTPFLHTQA